MSLELLPGPGKKEYIYVGIVHQITEHDHADSKNEFTENRNGNFTKYLLTNVWTLSFCITNVQALIDYD